MIKKTLKNNILTSSLPLIACISLLGGSKQVHAQIDMGQQPVLVITNKAMAPQVAAPIYNTPRRAPEITQQQIVGQAFSDGGTTAVGRKVEGISKDFFAIQSTVSRLAEQLRSIENRNRNIAAGYYASVATINTQLQSGTTPGNPRLIAKLNEAQNNLDTLANNSAELNAMAVEISNAASQSTFLLENIRAAYSLSGAIEEDHARLAQMEDQVNSNMVMVDRLLNNVNDGITRTNAYISTERNDLRTLALAVTNGDLYGKNLSNYPFSRAPQSTLLQQASFGGVPAAPVMRAPMAPSAGIMAAPVIPTRITPSIGAPSAPSVSAPQPLAKIRFDKANVDYQQPIYVAVQNAMQRYPNGRFELIAVHPTSGNPAQLAIESTRARRNAEKVLRTLTQMGVSMDKIELSNAPSAQATSNEVHLFLR